MTHRLWLALSAAGAVIAIFALVAVISYRTNTGQKFRHQIHVNCVQIETLKTAFRSFINDVVTPPDGTKLTPEQKANVARIEAFASFRFQPKRCP